MSRPTLRTAFCERAGIEYPIVLAGMGPVAGTGAPVATAELVAAVSNAGGLGVMGGVAYSPDVLRREIRKVRALTKKPFGVDLLLSPSFLAPRGTGPVRSMTRTDQLPKAHLEAIERIAASLGIELVKAPPEVAEMGSWVERVPADRIRHICVIGMKTFVWSFVNRGLAAHGAPPYVRLIAPSGAIWEWNEKSESARIEGTAVDFCQVVTQVRNVADTRLDVEGEVATRWLSIAQCFAGPPADRPKPGQRVPR